MSKHKGNVGALINRDIINFISFRRLVFLDVYKCSADFLIGPVESKGLMI